MRFLSLSFLACLAFTAVLAGAADAQLGQSCSDPIVIDRQSPPHLEITIDTRTWQNSVERTASCFDGVTSGPDVVFRFLGELTGTVTWTADFDAAVYVVADSCLAECEVGGSGMNGTISFATGYSGTKGDEVDYVSPHIVIDGLNLESGSIQLSIDWDTASPTFESTWGEVKSRFVPSGDTQE